MASHTFRPERGACRRHWPSVGRNGPRPHLAAGFWPPPRRAARTRENVDVGKQPVVLPVKFLLSDATNKESQLFLCESGLPREPGDVDRCVTGR